jgi:hypothetical protein
MQLAGRQTQHDRPELLQIMLLASQLEGQGGFEAPVYQLSRKLLREAMEASLGNELTLEQIERVTSTVMALLHLDESAAATDATTRTKTPRPKDRSTQA